MRLSQISLLICKLLAALTVVSATTEHLTKSQIKSLQKKDGIIRLTDATFEAIVSGPRDYTLAILLTAEGPQYSCAFCKIVGPAFRTLASNWYRDNSARDDFFFVIADVASSPKSFQKLGLTSAPNLWIYSPTEKAEPITTGYKIQRFEAVETQLQSLHPVFNELTGNEIHIKKPFPYDKLIGTIGAIGLVTMTSLKFSEHIIKFLQSKQLWVAVTMVSVLMFTGGHMFNMIRRTPYVIGDGRGGITYFTGGHSNQIAVETQIIAVAYAVGAFSVISLITKAPKLNDPKAQALLVAGLVVLILLTESFITAKFNIKNGNYPFKLLNIF